AREAGAGELPQAPQRDPHLPRVERDVGAIVAKAPLARDLHRRTAAAAAADADAGRMLAAVPVWGAPAGSDPAIAAVVALGLLCERLEEPLHQLVGGEALELRQLLRREIWEVLRVAQPFEHLVGDVELPFDAVEHTREHAVEGVVVGLALHQACAREVVEAEQTRTVQTLAQRFDE